MPRVVLPRLPVLVLAGMAAGLALRVAIWLTPLGRADSDEMVLGVMAKHLFDGRPPVFMGGQHYGGTIELVPVWFSLKVVGFNLVGLRLPDLVLAMLNAWLVYRLAQRSLAERAAQIAGLLMWTGPAAALWLGIHELLFYSITVTFGLVTLTLVHRLVEAPGRSTGTMRDTAWLGLVLGIGWWTSPNIVYFAIPAAITLVVRARDEGVRFFRSSGVVDGRRASLLVGCALAGMAPWIYDGIDSGWEALRASSTFPTLGNYPTRVVYLLTRALPGSVGARDMFNHQWAWGAVGIIAFAGVAVVLVIGWWKAAVARSWECFGFATFVVVFAAIPWSPDDPSLRYTFYASPFLVMLVARAAGGFDFTQAIAVLAASVVLTGVSLGRLYNLSEHGGTVYRVGNVPELDEVIGVLDQQGITRVWGDYWVAYRLDFETDERIISAPAAGIDRYPRYRDAVRAADRSAWVILKGTQAVHFVPAMRATGVAFQTFDTADFIVAVTDRPVLPEALPDAARRAPEPPRLTL